MKKPISLLLAAVLALGMTTTALADPPVGFDNSSPTNAMTVSAAGVQALPSLEQGNLVTLLIPQSMFARGEAAGAPTAAEARAYIRQAALSGGLGGVFDSMGVSGDAFPLTLTLKVKPGAPTGAFSGAVSLEGTGSGGAVVSSISTAVSGAVAEPPAPPADPNPEAESSLPAVEGTVQPLPDAISPGSAESSSQSSMSSGGSSGSAESSSQSGTSSGGSSGYAESSSQPGMSSGGSSGYAESSSQPGTSSGGTTGSSYSGSASTSSSSGGPAAENSSSPTDGGSRVSAGNGTAAAAGRTTPEETLATASYGDAIDGFAAGKTLSGLTTYTVDPGQAFTLGITGDMFTYTYGGALTGQAYQAGTHPQYPGDAALYAAGITAEAGGADGFRFEANVEDGRVKITPTSLARGGSTYHITVRLKSHKIPGSSGEGVLSVEMNSVADSMVNGGAVIDTAPVYRQAASGSEYCTWHIDHTQFILGGAGADNANQLTNDVLSQLSVVFTAPGMANLFDVTFNAGNAGYASVTLTVKSGLTGAHTVSGNIQLSMGGSLSQAVAISGQVGSGVRGSSPGGVPVAPMSAANQVVSMTNGASVLLEPTSSSAPAAASTFSAGDPYYTWEIDASKFQYLGGTAVADSDMDAYEYAKMTLVYGNANYASYFRPAFTQGDAANKAKLTLHVRSDATTLGDITLNSTLSLRFAGTGGTTQSAAVNLRGKIKPANAEAPGSGSKIDGFNTNTTMYSMPMTHNGTDLGGDPTGLELRPDDELRIYLTGGLFSWSGAEPGFNYKVTESQLRAGKVTVRKSVSRGSDTIDTLEFDTDKAKGAYIRLQFVESFVSTKEKDVVCKVYLQQKSRRNNDFLLEIDGTMSNEEREVYSGYDYVESWDDVYLKAMEYVRGIEIDMGCGVHLTTNLYTNQKYYAKALMTIDRKDADIMDDHPEIDAVITLKTVNLRTGSTKAVTLEGYDGYHVYNADGSYLGRSSGRLAFSDKYYLATKRISMETESVEIIEEETGGSSSGNSPSGSSGTGGEPVYTGATAASNSNSNPYTGR